MAVAFQEQRGRYYRARGFLNSVISLTRRLNNLESSNGKLTTGVMLVISNSYTLLNDEAILKHALVAWTWIISSYIIMTNQNLVL